MRLWTVESGFESLLPSHSLLSDPSRHLHPDDRTMSAILSRVRGGGGLMTKRVALVTGAGGEMGHLLLPSLRQRGYDVVALDLAPLPPPLAESCIETSQASVLDASAMEGLLARHLP